MDWKSAWLVMFTEAFEGVREGADGTYFVQGKEAFLPIVGPLSATQASHDFGPGVNTIAAHTRHAAYYVSLLNALARGEPVRPDWEASWSMQTPDPDEWRAIQEDLAEQYRELRGHVESGRVPNDQDQMHYTMAQLAHIAFHLGSVRQLAIQLPGRQP
jgi:hypothetical protein